MAVSRVYVGAHYPGDVITELALGAIIATAGWFVIVPPLRRSASWLTATPLRPLITTTAESAAHPT